jgi:HK97 family phage portal protein
MIFRDLFNLVMPPPPEATVPPFLRPEIVSSYGTSTVSNQIVSPETAKGIASAYRCANLISDDIASMPLQIFRRSGRNRDLIAPDPVTRNMAYLLGVSPNRWMTPFIFKKTLALWLIFWGNAYIWQPGSPYRELFILPANWTYPVFDKEGTLWYRTYFPSGKWEFIPAVEITHLMINSTNGFVGHAVLTYARETFGRQQAAHETQDRLNGAGLNPTAILWVNGTVNPAAREKLRKEYTDVVTGSANVGKAAIFDNTITKFETITMKPADAQFLESINATDAEIANFFGVPLYKLNMGKQSYDSNAQQDIDYLKTTINPYLVQTEQAGGLKLLSTQEQATDYLHFDRDVLLTIDAKSRAEVHEKRILSGVESPNEARADEDMSPAPGADIHLIPANYAVILPDGTIQPLTAPAKPAAQGG